ncbi:DUF6508 domain-containing protein [Flavobacterium sp. U410]|jgi:hypothetical protein
MIEIKNFEKHINNIKKKDWDSLFDLLPELKSIDKFGELIEPKKQKDGSYSFPYWSSIKIVDQTIDKIEELDLMPIFNWMKWKEGIEILSNKDFDYSSLDKITLCKLLTCIVRLERFNDGNIVRNFNNKVVQKILESLQEKIKNSDSVTNNQNLIFRVLKFFKNNK